VGANVEADAQQLVDFAIMGEAFARAVLGLERPTVGLLNVGAEDMKGHDSVKAAAQILRDVNLPMEFSGFVEGDDIAEGTVDVVVTDGFTGNIALKTAEGTAKLIAGFLRAALRRSFLGRLGAVIAGGSLKVLRRKLDPRAANGGIFLGLNGIVVKSHGGTDSVGFASALDMAIDMARAGVMAKIAADHEAFATTPMPAAAAAGVAGA
jgi:glycerol-3-phosphate acyltransferase PlsX